ncbi:MAG TPA: sensor histidine kinase [Segeticoccus sp.]|uniref:sensor histidine kinase n=1 Tax=Segeticoccus sp. TaxID=2706531 RepID=UPI002D7F53E3|nr:sensor histidine kinase [Segeticoccus sp.]HET8602154.1 sensor histidine kinase [Segeticoccus sp.]
MEHAELAHVTGTSPVLRGMQVGQHLLFAALLAIGAVRAAATAHHVVAVAVGAGLLALWYAAGLWLAARRRDPVVGRVWLAVLMLGWVALVALSPEFSWVAFSLFFLAMHLLPLRAAVPIVGVLTAAVVTAQLSGPGGAGNAVAKVLGPCVGALVAIGMSLAYRRLVVESEQRRRLVEQLVAAQDDLVATHDELVATQRQAGALAERARLARDIHDTLAQGFSSIVLLARAGLAADGADGRAAAPSGAGRAGPATRTGARVRTSADLLAQIEATAADNLVEARRVVHALAPAALEEAPLPAALGRLVTRLSEQTGIQASLQVDGDPHPLPTSCEVALLRVAQSGLANVRQHSGADRVRVTLTYQPDAVALDVVDDGRGFDPGRMESAPLGGTGFGLRAMRERLADLGGALVVETAPGDGTAIAATIPLRPETP